MLRDAIECAISISGIRYVAEIGIWYVQIYHKDEFYPMSLEEAKYQLKRWRAMFALALMSRPDAIEYLGYALDVDDALKYIVQETLELADRVVLSSIFARRKGDHQDYTN
jgi:hypothetical protein